MLKPAETLTVVRSAAVAKGTAPVKKLLIMGFLAGLFIAFAALASTIASMNLLSAPETFGLGKLVQGFVFAGGLIMVVLGSAELFTGNSLMLTGLISRQISIRQLLRNWGLVYLGNFCGAIFLAGMVALSGIFNYNGGLLGDSAIATTITKTNLAFWPALILGMLCNILVCLAVWFAFSARTIQGKILAIVFPIMLFIISGFEHSVANMYYIPAGFFASGNFDVLALLNNLIPVTLGNIIGGGLFVATAYHFSFNDATMNSWLESKSKVVKSVTTSVRGSRAKSVQSKRSQSKRSQSKKSRPNHRPARKASTKK